MKPEKLQSLQKIFFLNLKHFFKDAAIFYNLIAVLFLMLSELFLSDFIISKVFEWSFFNKLNNSLEDYDYDKIFKFANFLKKELIPDTIEESFPIPFETLKREKYIIRFAS